MFWQSADGTGSAERLLSSGLLQLPVAFTPDESILVLIGFSGELAEGIGMVRIPGDKSYEVLIDSPAREWQPALSADGRWLAYSSDESGRFEVYVRPFPDVGSGRTVVSTGGGSEPKWSADGRDLFYIGPQGMTVAAVTTEPTFSAGPPEILFDMSPYGQERGGGFSYDISPDGGRILLMKMSTEAARGTAASEIVIVQNWFEELARLVPVG